MPGVPSSRGCDACRKRKKRCDAVQNPTSNGCSWCRKLGIPCIGFGKQRFAFKDENKKLRDKHGKSSTTIILNGTDVVKPHKANATVTVTEASLADVLRLPSSPLVRLTQAFVNGVSTEIDVSHQLAWNFGGFLYEVPRRLGTNEALDASADLLITAHTKYCLGSRQPDVEVLTKQQRALSVLRRCLDDPKHAHSSETLCAVMIQSICEVFVGGTQDNLRSHYTGAAQILKSRGYSGPKDDFEKLLLLTLRGPVVVGALSPDGLTFTEDEWDSLIMSGFEPVNLDSEMMLHLCQMPSLVRHVRIALDPSTTTPASALDSAIQTARTIQEGYIPVQDRLRERWEQTSANFFCAGAGAKPTAIQRFTHCHHARVLAFSISFGILLNTILAKLQPELKPLMIDENNSLAEEILALAYVSEAYRPLGSLAMATFLGTAWQAATDPVVKERVSNEAMMYYGDLSGYPIPKKVEDLAWCMQRFHL